MRDCLTAADQCAQKEKTAQAWQGENGFNTTQLSFNPITKHQRITDALKLPNGLNRFEAERIGDHCLNSTVADIRKRYGNRLIQRWETVPSRFSDKGVRVLRYWIVGDN